MEQVRVILWNRKVSMSAAYADVGLLTRESMAVISALAIGPVTLPYHFA